MNEFLFLLQTMIIVWFAIIAARFGKGVLIAWISMQALIANLFVLKQISLFSFDVTASDAFAIGSLLGLNLLQERFGREEAQQATWSCFLILIFFTLVSQIHLLYTPTSNDFSQTSFQTILSTSPRLLLASMSVFFVVQQIDMRIFNFLKTSLPNTDFALRSTITLIFSQLLDTILFSFVGLYGIVVSVFDIIIVSFCIKLIAIFCSTSFLRLVKT